MPSKACVLLLRTPDKPPEAQPVDSRKPHDKYELAIRSRLISHNPDTLEVHSLGVLKTQATNVVQLASLDPSGVSGVVFTSARACEMWNAAMDIRGDGKSAKWAASGAVFYAVGKGTADALKDHELEFRGTQSGTAEKLGDFIAADPELKRRAAAQHLDSPILLYLTGDKNRDVLSKKLTKAGIELMELQAYETSYDEHFETALGGLLGCTRESSRVILGFFAPSSAKMALPVLREKGILIPSRTEIQIHETRAHIVAIGPTTAEYLLNEEHLDVAATAGKPTPEGLAEAVEATLSRRDITDFS